MSIAGGNEEKNTNGRGNKDDWHTHMVRKRSLWVYVRFESDDRWNIVEHWTLRDNDRIWIDSAAESWTLREIRSSRVHVCPAQPSPGCRWIHMFSGCDARQERTERHLSLTANGYDSVIDWWESLDILCVVTWTSVFDYSTPSPSHSGGYVPY